MEDIPMQRKPQETVPSSDWSDEAVEVWVAENFLPAVKTHCGAGSEQALRDWIAYKDPIPELLKKKLERFARETGYTTLDRSLWPIDGRVGNAIARFDPVG